jgi:hypothetical protein
MKYLDSAETEISLLSSKEPESDVGHQIFVTIDQATKTQRGVKV